MMHGMMHGISFMQSSKIMPHFIHSIIFLVKMFMWKFSLWGGGGGGGLRDEDGGGGRGELPLRFPP